MREQRQTDLLVIGAGPGGYVAALYARKKGMHVVLVEKEKIGGTCLNVGCIPTKSLVKSVELFDSMKSSDKYGVSCENPQIDLSKVIQRKDEVTKQLVSGISFLLEKNGVEVLQGEATFLDDHHVLVKTSDDEIVYEPKNVIIATGSKTKHLPIPGLDLSLVMDSEQLLANQQLPTSMVVVGGGIIGMEFAFIYAQMGVKVTVLEFLPQVLPSIDKEIVQRLMRYAKQLNISILTQAKVMKIEKASDSLKQVSYEYKGSNEIIETELVLEAVGRIPNYDSLGLENTSIRIGSNKGIEVNQFMETNVPNVYAIGDVTNLVQLAHVASHQALICVDRILGSEKPMDYQYIPGVIFTNPQIATIGKSEFELQANNITYQVHKVPFSAAGKSLINDSQLGFIKFLFNPENEHVYGVQIFGKEAEHLVAPITIQLQNNLPFEAMKETIFAHPTLQEVIHEGYLGLLNEPIHYLG